MSSIKSDDPVVKEIPVFLSQTLTDKLYIFQYPIRPASEGYDNTTFLQSYIKPENQQVKIELMVDTDSVTYDHSKGEQIALNADSGIKNEPEDKEKAFDSHLMDKLILDSSRVLSDCSHYAVGIFQDGELHITPLKSIIQIRPQFDYLDNSEKRAKEEAKMTGDDEEEEDSPKAVNVTFARQKPEFLKKLQEQSFQQHSKKTSEEKWIPTNYVPANSTQAELARLEMFCPLVDESVNTLNLTKNQYLELLAPPLKEEEHSKMSVSNHTTSLSYIRTLPLLDQIRILMKDAKVISFGQLRTIIASEHDTSSILKYLQQVAVLVQGNWIVNSELIYPKDSVSSQNGIPADLMCRARDYVLLSFLENEYLDRKAVSNVIKLPSEEIRDIFTNLARHQPKKGWQLIIPPNTEFPMRYPDIAQRQEMFWEAKQKQLREVMDAQNQTLQQGAGKSGKTGKVREHQKPGKVKDK